MAECCGDAANSLTGNKRMRGVLGAVSVLVCLIIPILFAIGFVCLADHNDLPAAILLSIAGGLLVIVIAVGITAYVRKKRRLKRLRETTETDGNEYRACVQCESEGITVDLAEKNTTVEQDAEKGE